MGELKEILKQRYHELLDWNVKAPHVPLSQRLKHFTWSWFACTMATGGVGLIIGSFPFRFYGLNTIGKIVYILQIFLLSLFGSCMLFRFIKYPSTIKDSWNHHLEKLFIATCLLSISTFIDMLAIYAYPDTGEWMVWVIRILYYIYVAVSFIYCVMAFFTIFNNHVYTIETASPAWILPIFPPMICGVIAGAVNSTQPAHQLKNMVIFGILFQGLGFWVYLLLFAVNVLRFFTVGLAKPQDRPGMFMFVGPPAFSGLALINIARGAMGSRPYIFVGANSSEYLGFVSTFMAIFIWGLAAWCYCLAMVSFLAGFFTRAPLKFACGWFAFIFPNVGFVNCTIEIGKMIDSKAFQMFGHIIGVILCIQWILLMYLMVRAFLVNDLCYPGKDEDAHPPPKPNTGVLNPTFPPEKAPASLEKVDTHVTSTGGESDPPSSEHESV
ncbi:Malic acid transport protein [Schizosaccharomyces pombe]